MVSSRARVAVGVAVLLVSSVAQLLQFAVTPMRLSDGDAGAQVEVVVGHEKAMRLAVWLDVPILLLIPAILYVGYAAGAGTSRLAASGVVAAFTSVLGAGYLFGTDVLVHLAAQASDRAGAVELLSAYESNGVVVVVLALSVLGGLVGFVLLGAALMRAGTVPVWAGAAVAASPVLEIIGYETGIVPVGVAGYALRAAGFAACAAALVRLGRAAAAGQQKVAA
ncbi:hypothetical protein ACTWPT_46485 [Nonomuraea sp. 3N208]|uniref:hypothetical protein n=1 Tax=Nonomuraea sp. 3N208 TaxID=3457421 RepID=UPI003FD2CA19